MKFVKSKNLKPNPLPATEELKKLFNYDPETGSLTWALNRGPARQGKEAGALHGSRGYGRVCINGRPYLKHRIIWAWFYGEDPGPDWQIDHINGDTCDNRILNLRKATESEQKHNRARFNNNTSGVVGVYFAKNKWFAKIEVAGKIENLGSFRSREEAIAARIKAEQEHGIVTRERP